MTGLGAWFELVAAVTVGVWLAVVLALTSLSAAWSLRRRRRRRRDGDTLLDLLRRRGALDD